MKHDFTSKMCCQSQLRYMLSGFILGNEYVNVPGGLFSLILFWLWPMVFVWICMNAAWNSPVKWTYANPHLIQVLSEYVVFVCFVA